MIAMVNFEHFRITGPPSGRTMGRDASRKPSSRSTNATWSSNVARGEICCQVKQLGREPGLPRASSSRRPVSTARSFRVSAVLCICIAASPIGRHHSVGDRRALLQAKRRMPSASRMSLALLSGSSDSMACARRLVMGYALLTCRRA
jgi:hypothetical protein